MNIIRSSAPTIFRDSQGLAYIITAGLEIIVSWLFEDAEDFLKEEIDAHSKRCVVKRDC